MSYSRLYSNAREIESISDYAVENRGSSRQLVVRWTAPGGATKVRGAPGLKESQAYPAAFGRAVVATYDDCTKTRARGIKREAEPRSFDIGELGSSSGWAEESWSMARLGPVLRNLLV